jgi:DMSO reductase anchor subunit
MLRRNAAGEWPLIGFTLMTQAAVGAFWALAAAEAFAPVETPTFLSRSALLVLLGFAGFATLLSLFHLGRPFRAPNALSNVKTSWLSREILSDLVFLACLATLWILAARGDDEGTLRTILISVGASAGFLLLFAMSRIYMIRTVPVWRGIHTPVSFFLSAFSLGPLLAAIVIPVFDDAGAAVRWVLAAAALAASGLAFAAMALFTPAVGLLARTQATLLAYPETKMRGYLAVRAAALLGAAACLLLFLLRSADGSPAPLALAAACAAVLASELAGRTLFYAMYSRVGV